MPAGRKQWYLLLEEIYAETAHPKGELRICSDCEDAPCEVGPEQVTLLPFEDEFIRDRLAARGAHVALETIHDIAGCKHCPFFRARRCAIHPHRPVDCRTYPMVPVFVGNGVTYTVSGVCPRRAGMDLPFMKLMSAVWNRLTPFLPKAWMAAYNERQPHRYLQDLGNIDAISAGSSTYPTGTGGGHPLRIALMATESLRLLNPK